MANNKISDFSSFTDIEIKETVQKPAPSENEVQPEPQNSANHLAGSSQEPTEIGYYIREEVPRPYELEGVCFSNELNSSNGELLGDEPGINPHTIGLLDEILSSDDFYITDLNRYTKKRERTQRKMKRTLMPFSRPFFKK